MKKEKVRAIHVSFGGYDNEIYYTVYRGMDQIRRYKGMHLQSRSMLDFLGAYGKVRVVPNCVLRMISYYAK